MLIVILVILYVGIGVFVAGFDMWYRPKSYIIVEESFSSIAIWPIILLTLLAYLTRDALVHLEKRGNTDA